MSEMTETLRYYQNNADAFAANTVDVSMDEIRTMFLDELPKGAYILDLGCGSGRDAKAFLEMGCRVDAADGSQEQ